MTARLREGDVIERLEIEAAWLVDPYTGREGIAALDVRSGVWHEVRWLDTDEARPELLVLPGLVELSAAADGDARAAAHGGYTRLVSVREQEALGVSAVHRPLAAGLGAAADGVPATVLGLDGIAAADEAVAVARALHELRQQAAETGPADAPPLHLAHLSTSAAVRLVTDARADRLPVTCDVTVAHLCLHDGWLGGDRRFSWQAAGSPWSGGPADAPPYHPATRLDPPLRSPAEALALAGAVDRGELQALSSGHLPRAAHELDVPYAEVPAGISALETCLPLVLAAADAGVLSIGAAARALTLGPAAIAHLPARPIAPGGPADFVLVDRSASWLVDEASIASGGRNTPLLGRRLAGRVLLTAADGRVAWLDPALGQLTRDATSPRR